MGFSVEEAGNGRDALALIRRSRPMVVLMDVNMPVMDGVEAVLALRADPRTRDVPIFALTGDVSLVNQRRIAEAGVDGFIEKPVRWEDLRKTLAQIQGRRGRGRQIEAKARVGMAPRGHLTADPLDEGRS
jgi:CheY-like chemotaxis protein